MKYIGKTIIELTDVRNGMKKTYIDHNTFMASNIEQKFRNLGIFQTSVLNNFDSTSLWQKLTGGLLMFDTAVADGANFAAAGQKMTARGYYGCSNNGSPVSLGSWNASESAVSSNAIQMVYDFTTSQGNGDIASVCLTSDIAGKIGMGNQDEDYNVSLLTNPVAWQNYNKSFSKVEFSAGCGLDGTYLYYGASIDGTTLTINRKYANAQKVDLIHYLTDNNTAGALTFTLASAPSHTGNLRLRQISPTKLVVVGYDGVYSSSNAISVIVVDLTNSTATVTEISNIPSLTDNYCNYGYGAIEVVGETLLAIPTYDRKPRVIVVDISDGSSATYLFDHPYSEWTGQNYQYDNRIVPMSDGLFMVGCIASRGISGFVVDTVEETIKPCEGANGGCWGFNGMNLLSNEEGSGALRLVQSPFYLATINNLETPVQKTTSQTMKVTYILARA